MNDSTQYPNNQPREVTQRAYTGAYEPVGSIPSYIPPPPPKTRKQFMGILAITIIMCCCLSSGTTWLIIHNSSSAISITNQPIATASIQVKPLSTYTAQDIFNDFVVESKSLPMSEMAPFAVNPQRVSSPPFGGTPNIPPDMIEFSGGANSESGQMYVSVFPKATEAQENNAFVNQFSGPHADYDDIDSWSTYAVGRCWLLYPWNISHATSGNFTGIMDRNCT